MGTQCLLAVLLSLAADREVPGPEVSVKPVMEVPTFVVGNAPFVTPCFETYVPTEHYFRQFAETGVRLFCFNTNVAACDYGHSRPTWLGPEEWDYSGFDERFERVLAACPDAMVMPRVNLGTPRWWLDAHPEALEVIAGGATRYTEPNRNPTVPRDRAFPSLASPVWRADMAAALERFLDHVQGSKYADHIFGYCLSGLDTEEWYHWSSGSDQLAGYSAPMQTAFREWLRDRYGSDEALARAWRGRVRSFDEVTVPSAAERFGDPDRTFRDPDREMNVIDWYLFYNDIVPETVDHFASVVRRKTAGTKAIGAFYGYMYEFRGDPEYGHNALGRFVQSENLDFMFVTASYGNRGFGTGGDYARSPAASVLLHGKLWYHDNDVVSFLAPEVMSAVGMKDDGSGDWSTSLPHQLKVLGYTETAEHTQWMYRRSMGFALCTGAYESCFDLHGGYYDDPELMAEVRRLNRLAEVAKRYPRRSNSQVLVVADEASCAYAGFRSPLLASELFDTQPTFIKVGAPADHVLLEDVHRIDTDRYRLVIMLNSYHMTTAQRQAVHEKLLNNGRTVVWCHAPGRFGESGLAENSMAGLTGMTLTCDPSGTPAGLRMQLVSGELMPEGSVVGPEGVVAEAVNVADPQAETLAVCPDSGEPVLARKGMGDWTSVYTRTANLPPALYRALARQAGVHLYNDRDDTLYANESFLCVHADGAGTRTLRFPWACDVTDMVTGEPVAVNTDTYQCEMSHGETRLLRWRTRL